MNQSTSLWMTSPSADAPAFPALAADTSCDVVIIGGGITGVTAARLLAHAGKSVVLVEARTLASGVTGRSTVHITEALDTRYQTIEKTFDRATSQQVARASRAAIERIANVVEKLDIQCGFLRRPGYLYSEDPAQRDVLAKEHEAALRAELNTKLLDAAPLPFRNAGAVLFPNQAQMNVVPYIRALAADAQARGAQICENSRVISIDEGEPCTIQLEHGPTITAAQVFMATHSPLNRVFLQTKIHAYRSYVLAFVESAAERPLADGLFWDTEDPYHYFSSFTAVDNRYFIVGGEDHKTGTKEDTNASFEKLAQWTKQRTKEHAHVFPPEPAFRWSAQVEEPVDGLPFIGRNSASTKVYVATGFSGNGITFGTVAAEIVSDLILGREIPMPIRFPRPESIPIYRLREPTSVKTSTSPRTSSVTGCSHRT